jgi:hypothetical protein
MAIDPITGNWVPEYGTLGSPAAAASAYQGLGLVADELAAARSPAADFENMMAMMQPYRQFTAPMRSLQPRLEARYMMAEPYMTSADTSFAQYLGDLGSGTGYGGVGYSNMPSLRDRLQTAANVATAVDMTPYAADIPAMHYRQMFGQAAGQNQQANQLAAATLLAQQRAGGGEYGGRMARAIRNAMAEMQSTRLAQGAPGENFLQWYLGATDPAAT